MLLSVSLKTNNLNILSDIFKNIPIHNYYWYRLGWTEIYNVINSEYVDFFDDIVISGEMFTDKLSGNVYPIMAHIGALPYCKKETSIKTLDDFIISDFEILLIITDSTEIDIYVKNRNYYEVLMKNISEMSSITISPKDIPAVNDQIIF